MEYVSVFVGGPLDGLQERRPTKRYGTPVLRSHVESGIQRMAVYEADPSQSAERVVYRYVETLSLDEGRARLDDTEWYG